MCMKVFKAVQNHSLLYSLKLMMNVMFFWFVVACLCIPFVFSWRGLLLGTGQWLVQNIRPCDNPEQYEIAMNISRKKINRTHDCFDLHTDFKTVFDCRVGVKIDVYKSVDGGFKYFETMADDCACKFLMRHAKENLQRALTMANIVPPDCPIPSGPKNIVNFVMDYKQLPKTGVYGTFEAVVQFATKQKKIGCMKITVNFDERNEN